MYRSLLSTLILKKQKLFHYSPPVLVSTTTKKLLLPSSSPSWVLMFWKPVSLLPQLETLRQSIALPRKLDLWWRAVNALASPWYVYSQDQYREWREELLMSSGLFHFLDYCWSCTSYSWRYSAMRWSSWTRTLQAHSHFLGNLWYPPSTQTQDWSWWVCQARSCSSYSCKVFVRRCWVFSRRCWTFRSRLFVPRPWQSHWSWSRNSQHSRYCRLQYAWRIWKFD